MKGFATLVERITPWLIEVGSWLFGAMIAFELVIIAALLTVGPVDLAALVATAAFALALPPDIAGFFLLRLVRDLQSVSLDEVAVRSFGEVGFTDPKHSSPDVQSLHRHRTRFVLGYSYAMLALSLVLVVVGMTAALWHMAWWIAIAFLVMVAIAQAIIIRVVVVESRGDRASDGLPSASTPP